MQTLTNLTGQIFVFNSGAEYEYDDNPSYSGSEFLANYQPSEHPYAELFQELLAIDLDPDIANIIAYGGMRIDLISSDWYDPLRVAAFQIFDKYYELGNYWGLCDNEDHFVVE